MNHRIDRAGVNLDTTQSQAPLEMEVLVPYSGPLDIGLEDDHLDISLLPVRDKRLSLKQKTGLILGTASLIAIGVGVAKEAMHDAHEKDVVDKVASSAESFMDRHDSELSINHKNDHGATWVYTVESDDEAISSAEYVLDGETYLEEVSQPERVQSLRIEVTQDEAGQSTVTLGSYEVWPESFAEVLVYDSNQPEPMAHWANDGKDNGVIEFKTNQQLDISSPQALLEDLKSNDMEFVSYDSYVKIGSQDWNTSVNRLSDLDSADGFLQPSPNNPYNK